MPLPLVTERLLLRPMTLDDLDALHKVTRDAETAWYGQASATRDDTRAAVRRHMTHQERHGFSLWSVELRETGEVIGAAGLTHLEGGPEIEVGYRFLRRCWGKGYATEAALASIAFGFEEAGLDRIVAVTTPHNRASRHVMEKCGLTFVGPVTAYGMASVKYAVSRAV